MASYQHLSVVYWVNRIKFKGRVHKYVNIVPRDSHIVLLCGQSAVVNLDSLYVLMAISMLFHTILPI